MGTLNAILGGTLYPKGEPAIKPITCLVAAIVAVALTAPRSTTEEGDG